MPIPNPMRREMQVWPPKLGPGYGVAPVGLFKLKKPDFVKPKDCDWA